MPIQNHSEALLAELLGLPEMRVPALAAADTAALVVGLVVDVGIKQILTAADPDSDNFLP